MKCLGLCLAHCGHYGTAFYYYFYYLEDCKDVNNIIRSQVEINLKIVMKIAGSFQVREDYFIVISRGLGSSRSKQKRDDSGGKPGLGT